MVAGLTIINSISSGQACIKYSSQSALYLLYSVNGSSSKSSVTFFSFFTPYTDELEANIKRLTPDFAASSIIIGKHSQLTDFANPGFKSKDGSLEIFAR